MTPFSGELSLPGLERVISGPDTIERLGDELDRLHARRVVVVTGRTLAASALLERLTAQLGGRCVAVFGRSRQHVPSSSVADLLRVMDEQDADGLVSFGGGSPIDTAKAAVHARLTPASAAGAAHVAVPTTLSAGEFTSVAGVTDDDTLTKLAIHDGRIAPRSVITDPTLTYETPRWLWAATGVRSLDHAVESMYSIRHHPFSDAVASQGLALLVEHLPRSTTGPVHEQLTHRSYCQVAAWMAVFGMTTAGFGLSHALGHQIGPRWNVPHGVTSCITLPHVMRFMARLAPERFEPIARALDVPFDAAVPETAAFACADQLALLIAALEVPQRLRDVGVPASGLGDLARVVHGLMDGPHVIGRDVTVDDVTALLNEAY
jgi:alcohol dehydrogenase